MIHFFTPFPGYTFRRCVPTGNVMLPLRCAIRPLCKARPEAWRKGALVVEAEAGSKREVCSSVLAIQS